MQSFEAAAVRGKQIRYRAWLRVDDPSASRAQLFVRVDWPGAVGFHDYSHAVPIRARQWSKREITGQVDRDATHVTIGFMLGGRGSAYMADPEFEVVQAVR
jgi:hypothetical protein